MGVYRLSTVRPTLHFERFLKSGLSIVGFKNCIKSSPVYGDTTQLDVELYRYKPAPQRLRWTWHRSKNFSPFSI